MRCPIDYGSNIVSNKLSVPGGHDISHAVRAARELGHPVIAGLGAMAWIGATLANHVRKDFKCLDCGHTFNEGD